MIEELLGGKLGVDLHWLEQYVQWGELDSHAVGSPVQLAWWQVVYIHMVFSLGHAGN